MIFPGGCFYCRETIAKGEEYVMLLNGYGAHARCMFQQAKETEQARERAEREAGASSPG